MRKLGGLMLAVALLAFTSCIPHSKIAYLQELEEGVATIPATAAPISATVQSADLLQINITSINPEVNSLFTFQQGNADSKYGANSYLVDGEGNVELPLIGSIPVAGRTTDQVADTLRTMLNRYMESPSVNVRLMNFAITVLGEVNKPGVYEIAGARANVLEALGLAGDLTIYGKRNNVLLIRESDGKREYRRIDLTKSDFLSSSWYNLQNKDVLYVEPSKGRTSSDDNLYRVLPVVLSSLTFLTVIITNLSR